MTNTERTLTMDVSSSARWPNWQVACILSVISVYKYISQVHYHALYYVTSNHDSTIIYDNQKCQYK